MELLDKVALGVLGLTFLAIVVSIDQTNRYFFIVVLVLFLILYLMSRRIMLWRRGRELRDYRRRMKDSGETYWSNVGSTETPEEPQGE